MQSTITQFLRDHMTGDPSINGPVHDAVIIPVSERNTLARTMTTINREFDRLEKNLLAPARTPATAAVARRTDAERTPASKRAAHRSGAGGGPLWTAVGALTGMAISMMGGAGNRIRAAEDQSRRDLTAAGRDMIGASLRQSQRVWDGVNTVSVAASNATLRGVGSLWNEADRSGKSLTASHEAGIATMRDTATGENGVRFMPGELDKTDAEVSQDARDAVDASVTSFIGRAIAVVKKWLYTLFSDQGDELTAGGSAGAGGGSTPGSTAGGVTPAGGRGGGGTGTADSNQASRYHAGQTAGDATIPGTDEKSSGWSAIDERMSKMSPGEREAYRNSDQYGTDTRAEAWQQKGQGGTLGARDGFSATSGTGDPVDHYSWRHHSAEQKEQQEAYVYHRYRDMGYSEKGAVKAMGNDQRESELDSRNISWGDARKTQPPTPVGIVLNGRQLTMQDSLGLAQWNGDRLLGLAKWATEHKQDPLSLSTQMDYKQHEMQSGKYKSSDAILRNDAEDVREGTAHYGHVYEGYGDNSTDERADNAVRFQNRARSGAYEKYGKSSSVPDGPAATFLDPQGTGTVNSQRIPGTDYDAGGSGFGRGITPDEPTPPPAPSGRPARDDAPPDIPAPAKTSEGGSSGAAPSDIPTHRRTPHHIHDAGLGLLVVGHDYASG